MTTSSPARLLSLAIAAAALALIPLAARAQASFPDHPLTMIVPFAPGGNSDVTARLIADEMGRVLEQRIVVENIAGAGGSTGMGRLAKAAPDGYTIGIGNAGTSAAVYTLYKEATFKPESFIPFGIVAKSASILAVKKDFPAKDLKEFLAYAKANPGKINLGHAGIGSSNYLICKLFVAAAKVDVVLVSYRGAAPALNDVNAGHIDGVCDTSTSVGSSIQANTVRGMALAARQRLRILPDLPTSIEAGLPEFQAEGWNALFLPAGASPEIVGKLNAAMRKALANPALKTKFEDLGGQIGVGEELSPDYVAPFIVKEVEKYKVLLAE